MVSLGRVVWVFLMVNLNGNGLNGSTEGLEDDVLVGIVVVADFDFAIHTFIDSRTVWMIPSTNW